MRRWNSMVLFALALTVLAISVTAHSRQPQAQIGINITIAPPELPVYDQPPLPAPGYLWIPGYWSWGPDGYYWVPGYWEEPPAVGLLWTPGYWGWHDGLYAWNDGYWGPHIGFYGGVNYGFGYVGTGYEGGRWNNGVFAYNRTVNNFGGVHVTNVYNQTVVVNNNVTRVSFNGGTGGTAAQPTPQEQAVAQEQHVPPTTAQTQHQQTASTNRALLASENHGKPAIAATSKPNEFSGKGVVAAHEATPGNTASGGKPGGAGPNGINPNAAKTLGSTNPNAAKTLGTNPNGAKVLGTNPNAPKTPGTNTSGTNSATTTLEKGKEGPGTNRAMLNNGTNGTTNGALPKPANVGVKPLVATPHNLNTVPPQPHPAAALQPHPVVAAPHPPAPHPPAPPHPQAKPAPHPNDNKKPS
jgi:hypothetical protein